MKTGVIDVGGGLRGIYGAGVLDRCLDDGVSFDVGVGVSAGSANLASFLAGQRGRNYLFYTEYSLRPEYMSARRILQNGEYLDLDYIYGTLSNTGGEYPLDAAAIHRNPTALFVVATDAQTGETVFFTKNDLQPDRYRIFNASCAIPLVCKPQRVGDRSYYDGGVSQPVPLQKAIDEGCDRIVLILTRPLSDPPEGNADLLCAEVLKKRNAPISELVRGRRIAYLRAVDIALRLQNEGRCLIVAPDDACGIKTLTKSPEKLDRLYKKGYEDASRIRTFLESD